MDIASATVLPCLEGRDGMKADLEGGLATGVAGIGTGAGVPLLDADVDSDPPAKDWPVLCGALTGLLAGSLGMPLPAATWATSEADDAWGEF